ncbi:MAG TPA: nucleotide exchange factor GrpE [Solirubrobacteraceae bacterium]|nr:nucleotide exchange factor GrpE [Solirubrobacteraceae bacterium]
MTEAGQTLDEEPRGAPANAAAGQDDAAEVPPRAPAAAPAAERAPQGDVAEPIDVAAQRDEYLALAQRTQADFENFRKRVAKEAIQAKERGVVALAKELLPALDNLDRALAAAANPKPTPGRPAPSDGAPGGTAEDASLLQGVKLVREELAAALARAGVQSFSPAGETFDPEFHEAMAQQPVAGVASGIVAEVYQDGYRLGEQLIRPARVVVAQ